MKLGEALTKRAALQREVTKLYTRINNVATVAEGDTPVENPGELIAEMENLSFELADLIARINHTNADTFVELDGQQFTITQLLARRDAFAPLVSNYMALASMAATSSTRFMRTEIKYASTLDAIDLRQREEAMSELLARIDVVLQQANWTVDILDTL